MITLVTGGAGFIGSHLVEHLLGLGDEVVVLDDFSTGRIENLHRVRSHPRLRMHVGSILEPALLASAMRGVDRVFHLAAAVGVQLILDRPLDALRTNVHGTEHVLEACLESGASVVLVSTSEIYGKNTADRLTEDADRVLGSPLTTRWTYAAAKGLDEAIAGIYVRDYGLRCTIVRPFNTVGPRQRGRYGMVLPRLVGQALRGEPLTVYGDGRQTRCFCFVGDLVPALVRLAEHDEAIGRAFNLGGAEEVSILDLARRVIRVTGSRSEIRHVAYETAYGRGYEDMRRRVPDNGAAKALVGFTPSTGIESMIMAVAHSLAGRLESRRLPASEPVLALGAR